MIVVGDKAVLTAREEQWLSTLDSYDIRIVRLLVEEAFLMGQGKAMKDATAKLEELRRERK